MTDNVSMTELQLATRNHGMPVEALHYPITPVGLHYLLIHYDIPVIDPAIWRLRLDGLVRKPIQYSLEELRRLSSTTRAVTMECAGNGRALLEPRPASQPWLLEAVGTGEWTGVPLATVLSEAGVAYGAVDVVFTGADRGIEGGTEQNYQRSLPAQQAMSTDAILAYELNGQPLPVQHGFPLRLVVPGWYGMTNVKWLNRITVLSEQFTGYQNEVAYRFRQDASETGEPVSRMVPRSLLIPPGIPDFFSRVRTLRAGICEVVGRAWSGFAPVVAIEVSVDGGRNWHEAELDESGTELGRWQRWHFVWNAMPGTYQLCCRATDGAGYRQPVTPEWNLGGYANNAVQQVPVTVTE